MRKLLVSLISILIILIGIHLIAKLSQPNIELERSTKTTEAFDNYNLYNFGDNFKTISLNNITNIDCYVDGVNVKYDGDNLTMNDLEVNNVSYVYPLFSVYDESLLVIAYTKDDTNYILNYNYKTGKEEYIDSYKDMIIDFSQDIIFEEVGYIVNYTFIKDNKHLKMKGDICSIKKSSIVSRAIEYYYDTNSKFIGNNEELYSADLYSYIEKNKLCR